MEGRRSARAPGQEGVDHQEQHEPRHAGGDEPSDREPAFAAHLLRRFGDLLGRGGLDADEARCRVSMNLSTVSKLRATGYGADEPSRHAVSLARSPDFRGSRLTWNAESYLTHEKWRQAP